VGTSNVATSFPVGRPGGDLEVHDLTRAADTGTDGGTSALVLAAHGITANACPGSRSRTRCPSGPARRRCGSSLPTSGVAPAAGDCGALGASARTSMT
jgi:hypothetical protein